MAYFGAVSIRDGANLDAFSRLRVSDPGYAFDTQLTNDLAPLVFEQIVSGSGASIAHDTTNRCALLTFASTPTGGQAIMQSFEWVRYQPGRSLAAFVTFAFGAGVANVTKFAGIGDGANGVQFERVGASTVQLVLYSDTAHGDEPVTQAAWNLDTLDGSGGAANPSGLLLDPALMQILVIDLQALYAGRVRCGFDIGGQVVYVHQYEHANVDPLPYIQTASLPVRVGMTCTGTVSATMHSICSTVITEGGTLDEIGYTFSTELTGTAGNGARAHIGSLRPRTTFASLPNRSKFVLESVDVTVTGSNPILYEIVIGQAITGASWSAVNTTYSAIERSAGTISGSPAIVIASGYVQATTGSSSLRGVSSRQVASRYPITLDAAGAARLLGTLSVLGTGIGGTSAMRVVVNWREIR